VDTAEDGTVTPGATEHNDISHLRVAGSVPCEVMRA
jgi:hypothetical protein